jgi:hypothetical protein
MTRQKRLKLEIVAVEKLSGSQSHLLALPENKLQKPFLAGHLHPLRACAKPLFVRRRDTIYRVQRGAKSREEILNVCSSIQTPSSY